MIGISIGLKEEKMSKHACLHDLQPMELKTAGFESVTKAIGRQT